MKRPISMQQPSAIWSENAMKDFKWKPRSEQLQQPQCLHKFWKTSWNFSKLCAFAKENNSITHFLFNQSQDSPCPLTSKVIWDILNFILYNSVLFVRGKFKWKVKNVHNLVDSHELRWSQQIFVMRSYQIHFSDKFLMCNLSVSVLTR